MIKRIILGLGMGSLLAVANAQTFIVLEEDFETDPENFTLTVEETGDASAMVEYGDVGGSRGLLFTGNWMVKEGVEDFEFANGVMTPQVPTFDDFDIYPQDLGGLATIDVAMDAIFAGLPGDTPDEDFDFLGFAIQLWQAKDGAWDVYPIAQAYGGTEWSRIGWTGLRPEDFMRSDGSMPDFSATAEPMVLGFFTGVGIRWIAGPGQDVQLSSRIDNLLVEVTQDPIFSDQFEL